MSGDLAGRTAFVSGSGRNIGRAIVLDLAARGCSVVVNGSADERACELTADEARGMGVEAQVAMGDVSRADSVQRIAAAALERFGTIDIVINNAALRPHKPFLELEDDDWQRVLDIDLTASFLTSRVFLPGMVSRGWGRIVGMTGLKSIDGYFEGAPISAAKHGLWGLTKALAKEFGPHGITANVVSPGAIRSDHEPAGERIDSIPLGRKGDPSDIAGAVSFLVSEAGGYVSGQMIAVNGGART